MIKMKTIKKKWFNGMTISPVAGIVTDGLVLWLDGRDFTNSPPTTELQDRSGNGNNATANNFAYTSESGSDGAGGVQFDGVDDRFRADSVWNSFTVDNAPFTLGCVATLDEITAQYELIDVGYAKDNLGFRILISGTTLLCQIYDGTKYSTTYNGISSNTEYDIVATYDGTTVKLYLDGINVSETSVGSWIKGTSVGVCIGAQTNGAFPLKGNMRVATIYNRALSQEEVTQNYNALIQNDPPLPVFHFSAENFVNGEATYTDLTGNFTLNTHNFGWNENSGKVGDYVKFDGVDDYLEMTTVEGDALDIRDQDDMTIIFKGIFYSDSLYIVFKNESDWNNSQYGSLVYDSKFRFIVAEDYVDIVNNDDHGVYKEIAFTRSGENVECFENGVFAGTDTNYRNSIFRPNFCIGARPSVGGTFSLFSHMDIKEVLIFKGKLTEAQINEY